MTSPKISPSQLADNATLDLTAFGPGPTVAHVTLPVNKIRAAILSAVDADRAQFSDVVDICVDVWDADLFGDGTHSGDRWTIYPINADGNIDTDSILARGQLPAGLAEKYAGESEWLYGSEVTGFLFDLLLAGGTKD